VYDAMRSTWVVGAEADARELVTGLAATYGVDEVMVHPVAGASRTDVAHRNPARERTLELLAPLARARRGGSA
jgi:hypothetical protein